MNTPSNKTLEILLVEDNWGDALLMKTAFKKRKFEANLTIVTDGEQALAYLNREDKYHSAPLPDLILLDLNMPRMDGRAFLRRVKRQAHFSALKVVVLSVSQLDSDFREMSDMRIDGYLVKPRDLYGFYQMMKDLEDFLLHCKPLPQRTEW